MKITVGYLDETWGEVHFDGHAITYSGPGEGSIRTMLTYMRRPGMTDEELFFSLPLRCGGFQWTSEITNDDGSLLPHHLEAGWLPSRFFGKKDAHDWRPREQDIHALDAESQHPRRTAETSD